MAHIRRKFFDLVVAHQSPIAIQAVERIRSFYKIEEQIRGRPAVWPSRSDYKGWPHAGHRAAPGAQRTRQNSQNTRVINYIVSHKP